MPQKTTGWIINEFLQKAISQRGATLLVIVPMAVLVMIPVLDLAAFEQGPQQDRVERARRMLQLGNKGPGETQGITTNGQIAPGLFGIQSTGVSTAPVRKAAEAFLAALTLEQRTKAMFGVDDPEWRKWMNQSFYVRQGVSFKEMSETQRDAAFGLMRASLSAKGLKLTRDIMRLNHTLGELNGNDFEQYGEWLYNITVMGAPTEKEPWGWQLDGHHAIVNYFVLNDQVVMTPFFAGSAPVTATSAKYRAPASFRTNRPTAWA